MEKFEKPSILENKDVQNADQSTLNTKQELMSALEDEITNKGLAKELKVSHKRITRIAEKYIESNPEYLVWRKDTMGRGKWHYSRDLSNIIREQLSKEKIEAPEASPGEITTYALSKELNTTFQRVDKIAKEYQESHPEYFIWRRDTQGRRTWHYTQIFADILRTRIKQEDIENPEAEQGEITNSALAKELGRSPDTIQKIVDEYKESHPEYFVYRKDKKNNIYLHYTREFTDIIRARIRKEYLETPEAEQGEIINKALAEEVGRSPQTIQRLAHEYKESHPEYFVWRRDKGGNGRWHYSVILADIIRERVKQEDMEIPYAGSGEIPNTVLAEELKVTQQAIQKIADEYKESHLEYFVWRRDVMGKKFIYYTPEFADILRARILQKKLELPDAGLGEITRTGFAKELDESLERIEKIADEYKDSNPEYFVWRKDTIGKKSLHYIPELTDLIRERVKKENNEAPKPCPGEIHPINLAKELNMAVKTLMAIAEEYKQSNPNYFLWRRSGGRKAQFYSKEFVDLIRKRILRKRIEKENVVPEAPENWRSSQDISDKIGASKEEIEKIARKLRQQYQGQFGKFKDKKTE